MSPFYLGKQNLNIYGSSKKGDDGVWANRTVKLLVINIKI